MIRSITYQEAVDFLLPRHYSGRKPQVSYAFGWFIDDTLVAVCTFGKPASYTLCNGVCGKEFSKYVIELNRLCRVEGISLNLSYFVSYCLKNIPPSIVVSYSDTAMNHHGYILILYILDAPRRGQKDMFRTVSTPDITKKNL